MAVKVPIPKLGQSEETVTIASWRVKEGDTIKKGDILFEVETDKAVLEVESQFAGKLLKIFIPAGKVVPVMSICAVIGEAGEAIPAVEEVKAAPAPVAEKKAAAPAAAAPAPAAAPASVPKSTGKAQQRTFDSNPRPLPGLLRLTINPTRRPAPENTRKSS